MMRLMTFDAIAAREEESVVFHYLSSMGKYLKNIYSMYIKNNNFYTSTNNYKITGKLIVF